MKWISLRAAVVVAAVYGFFLIFAQFAFVELLRVGGAGLVEERVALGAMAVAGVSGGFLAAWCGASPLMIRRALGLAAVAAAAAPYFSAMPGAVAVAVATGLALGVATTMLAALVPAWCGVAWVGLETGLGYALCNIPAIFMHPPECQARTGAVFALIGLAAVPSQTEWKVRKTLRIFPFWGAVAIFTALVWMDSAAFFIIQHVEGFKSGTWGAGMLWRNAAVHLVFAIIAGLWLRKGGAKVLPGLAWALLAVAALAVNKESTRHFSGWIYPAAVSLYSTALVAWPGGYSGADGRGPAAWRAAWLFSIAGWFGSANGIGMAQTLRTVPPLFVTVAGAVVAGVMVFADRRHWRPLTAVGAVVLAVVAFPQPGAVVTLAAERGRRVYLAEGCIHCHSQYVRPGSPDEETWGPVRPPGDVLKGEPVLIGNRRQGPDLTNVGARRSEAWLKLHFIQPRTLAPDSTMPSYAYLFESGKGDDLVAYLKQSGTAHMADVMARAFAWNPAGNLGGQDGKKLFSTHCAACHGPEGLGNGPLSLDLPRKPANLATGPFVWTPPSEDLGLRVARIIRFGLPVTDMPGHETLADAEILTLRDYVLQLRGKK